MIEVNEVTANSNICGCWRILVIGAGALSVGGGGGRGRGEIEGRGPEEKGRNQKMRKTWGTMKRSAVMQSVNCSNDQLGQ